MYRMEIGCGNRGRGVSARDLCGAAPGEYFNGPFTEGADQSDLESRRGTIRVK